MPRCVGVALGYIAADALFSFTWATGERTAPVFEGATTHKLDDDTPKGVIGTISGLAGDNLFGLSCPLGIPEEQRATIRDLKPCYPMWLFQHSHVFVNSNDFGVPDDMQINVLFIDVTPGQASAEFIPGSKRYGKWGYPGHALPITTSLKDASTENLSPRDVIDKLVAPIVPESASIQQIGILRPGGPCSDLSSALENRFPDTLIRWVTLSDLSRGTAAVIYREIYQPAEISWTCGGGSTLDLPLGISLADERILTVIGEDTYLSITRRATFTTSRDNQTVATVRIFRGISPFGKLVIEGLAPQPKGVPRLQVSFDIDDQGEAVVTVEDLNSEAMTVVGLPNVLNTMQGEEDAYLVDKESQQPRVINAEDGFIGELPQ